MVTVLVGALETLLLVGWDWDPGVACEVGTLVGATVPVGKGSNTLATVGIKALLPVPELLTAEPVLEPKNRLLLVGATWIAGAPFGTRDP